MSTLEQRAPGITLADFPSLAGMTYLNTAAEGIPPRPVIDAIHRYADDKLLGMDGRERHAEQWKAVRALIARSYGLRPDECAFCSCTSEAFNLLAAAVRLGPGDEIVINDLDYPAGTTPWHQPGGAAVVKVWRSRAGALRVEDLLPLLGPRTRIVPLSLVSFLNGYMLPLREVVDAVRSRSSALIALDVTQALGRVPLDLAGVDFIVSSTHKWILGSHGGGLVGIPAARAGELTARAGGWFNRRDAFAADRFERPAELLPGAGSFAVGMPNYAAVYAVRAALDYIHGLGGGAGVAAIHAHAQPLTFTCLAELRKLPVDLMTPAEPDRLAGIIAFRHPKAAEIHRRLHERGIHIMSQAGRLRVAIHGYNTAGDIDRFLRELKEALTHA
ncbi:MAG: aminotransferase class V-fold PLP-dependent enzyme [Planctomycetota bacterium]|nr:aminotransferase class V-fold PLP-dependent enzyme [Planctomycetota bacterium]